MANSLGPERGVDVNTWLQHLLPVSPIASVTRAAQLTEVVSLLLWPCLFLLTVVNYEE
jgi:hypothetical protein